MLGVALFLVLVGVVFLLWRSGGFFRSGVELIVNTDNAAVFMKDEQELVDLFATHGWWETGVRTIENAVDGKVQRVQPRLIVIEITDEIQPFRDLYQGEVFGSYGVYLQGEKVVVRVQAAEGASEHQYGRTLDTELTKAAIMEAYAYGEEQKGDVYNQYLAKYQTGGWPGYLRVGPR